MVAPTKPAQPSHSVTIVDPSVSYEVVAANTSTAQPLGATGAVGDFLNWLTVQPATTTPGAVTLKDGSDTVLTIPTGTFTLQPYAVFIGASSKSGAWTVATGLNVAVVAVGSFT